MFSLFDLSLPGRLPRGGPAFFFQSSSGHVFSRADKPRQARAASAAEVPSRLFSAFLCVLCASALAFPLLLPAFAAPQSPAAQPPAKKKKKPSSRARRQLAPDPARVKEIQQALAREGFYQAEPTGKWDDATVAAMKNFQQSKGLPPTGKIEALSLQKLGLGSPVAGLAPPSPPASPSPQSDPPRKPQ